MGLGLGLGLGLGFRLVREAVLALLRALLRVGRRLRLGRRGAVLVLDELAVLGLLVRVAGRARVRVRWEAGTRVRVAPSRHAR